VVPQIGHQEFHALGCRVLRRFRKFVRRTPRTLAEGFGDFDGLGEAASEPEGLIFVAIVAFFLVPVLMVLSGALGVLDEVIFG
jgi:hypothetical protein